MGRLLNKYLFALTVLVIFSGCKAGGGGGGDSGSLSSHPSAPSNSSQVPLTQNTLRNINSGPIVIADNNNVNTAANSNVTNSSTVTNSATSTNTVSVNTNGNMNTSTNVSVNNTTSTAMNTSVNTGSSTGAAPTNPCGALDMTNGAIIQGNIVDAVTGSPIPGISVQFRYGLEYYALGISNSSGQYTLCVDQYYVRAAQHGTMFYLNVDGHIVFRNGSWQILPLGQAYRSINDSIPQPSSPYVVNNLMAGARLNYNFAMQK